MNGYHSRLKGWIAHFQGRIHPLAADRWLPSYLGQRSLLDGKEKLLPEMVLKSAIQKIDFNTSR